jgi:hypothetical protein
MDIHQTKTLTMQEKTDAKLKETAAGQEHLKEEIKAWRKKMKFRREATEASLEMVKIKPKKMKAVLE